MCPTSTTRGPGFLHQNCHQCGSHGVLTDVSHTSTNTPHTAITKHTNTPSGVTCGSNTSVSIVRHVSGGAAMPKWLQWITVVLVLLSVNTIQTVRCMRMMTRPEVYTVNLGDPVMLRCEFEKIDFNLFNNPILWSKLQKRERVQINMMSNVYEPFFGTQRFRLNFVPVPPQRSLELQISNASRADSGNYTCEVRSPDSRTLASVTHELIVKAPVNELYITNQNVTLVPPAHGGHTSGELVYTEGVPSTLRCVGRGGFPQPTQHMTVDDRSIQEITYWRYSPSFTGQRGLRTIAYSVEQFTHEFVALAEHDNKYVKCTSAIPDGATNFTRAKLRVNYAPKISCERAEAYLGEHNVTLTCLIASRPRVSSRQVNWVLQRGTSDFNLMKSSAYVILTKNISETSVRTTLYIGNASLKKFQVYHVTAQNHVDSTRQSVPLVEVPKPSPTPLPTTRPPPITKGPHSQPAGGAYVYATSGSTSSTSTTTTTITTFLHHLQLHHVVGLMVSLLLTACLTDAEHAWTTR